MGKMIPTFVTYELFHDKDSSREFIRILKKHRIEHRFEDDSPTFDPSFVNHDFHKGFRIKIQPKDFQQVDELMVRIAESQFTQVTPDYFLFSFTNKELLNVIAKRDEWGHFNFAFAQKLLRDRGVPVSQDQLIMFYQKRIEELAKPKNESGVWIFTGYIFAFLGGLIGLFIGWHLMTFKKTLPNGQQVNGYSTKDRVHGKYIVVISVCVLLLVILKRIFTGEASRF